MRAKFASKDEQRKFFLEVKRKTKMGSRKLSRTLNLKSRGGLESYTSGRTSPDLEVVKRLEEISGVKGNYEMINVNKLVLKKRKLMPMDIEDAKYILHKIFREDYGRITEMINHGHKQDEIIKNLRGKGYIFDNSVVSRAIGTLKTYDRVKIVDEIKMSDSLIFKGLVQDGGRGLTVSFNIGILHDKIIKNKIGIEIQDKNKIRIFPFKNGRKLFYVGNKRLGFHLPPATGLKHNSKLQIIINFSEFGFDVSDSVQDNDAKTLLKIALNKGFTLYPYRSTSGNLMGDIVLQYKNKTILIEITRAKKQQAANWKLGQGLLQRINYPLFENFIVVRKDFLRRCHLDAFEHIGTKYIFTDFSKDWENGILDQIKAQIDNST